MTTTIKQVASRADLRRFIRFNYTLYKNNPYAVPDLELDAMHTLRKDSNPAFDFCEADYFLAYQGKRLVGRVAAIINHRANEAWNKQVVRFGWLDFVDDPEVSRALLDAVAAWGRERGMVAMEGPLGFTDMDKEGMLIEGYEELGTMATIYNYPYYPQHMEQLGFEKAMDWIEMKLMVPEKTPEKYARIAEIVQRKLNLRVHKIKNRSEVTKSGLGKAIFTLINEAYRNLFGYSEMTERQMNLYINEYLGILDLDMVTCIMNEADELVAVGISMASMSEALQRAKGRMFPFGWWHLLKALKWRHAKILDLLLVAVRPDYQGKGVNAMLFTDLIPIYQKKGFEWAESNPELETNDKVQSQWQYLDCRQHKRRRCFRKDIAQ